MGKGNSLPTSGSLLLAPTITIAKSSSTTSSVGGGPPTNLGTRDSSTCLSRTYPAPGSLNPASSSADVSTGKKLRPVPIVASSPAST